MQQMEKHTMELLKTHPSGAEEWVCPTCNRRFLVQWPPNYRKIILEPGDEYAVHNGGKGDVAMGTPRVQNGQNGDSANFEASLAQIWLDAIEGLDFGDWPDSSDM